MSQSSFQASNYQSDYSILQHRNVKVDQKSDSYSTEAKIRKQLRLVKVGNLLNAFQLQDDTFLNDDVDSIATFQSDVLVHHWQWNLRFKLDVPQFQFATQASFICRLEQSRAKLAMDLNRCSDNIAS